MADPPARVAQGLSTRSKLRLLTFEQQTPDRIASVFAGLRPEPGVGFGQKTPETPMPLLRCRDEHRANMDTACFPSPAQVKRSVH